MIIDKEMIDNIKLSNFTCKVWLKESPREISFNKNHKVIEFNHLSLNCIENKIYISNFMDRKE